MTPSGLTSVRPSKMQYVKSVELVERAHAARIRAARRAFEFGDDLYSANLRPALRDHRARRKRRPHHVADCKTFCLLLY
jgi:hypothetical protein